MHTRRVARAGVVIINCARGGIVNEADLLEALASGKVGAAGIDTFEQEPPGAVSKALIAHPRVVCTPHLGASTEEAQRKVAREIAQQMCDAFALRGFVGVVNAPHLALAHKPTLEPFVRLSEALGRCVALVPRGARCRVAHRSPPPPPPCPCAACKGSCGAGPPRATR
jgi:D-3-phosphoglycerate dehydrogenase / 2-oxoglutarate reductase